MPEIQGFRVIKLPHDYRDLGIIGEPNFDVDYTKVFYITDTGRKWNNEAASDGLTFCSPFRDLSFLNSLYKRVPFSGSDKEYEEIIAMLNSMELNAKKFCF